MEINQNTEFDKVQFLRTAVNQFIHKETPVSVDRAYEQLIGQLSMNVEPDATKRKILKICRDLFTKSTFREFISNFQKQGVHPNQLTSIIVNHISYKVLGRHFDMSNLCCEGMVSNVTPSSENNSNHTPETIPLEPIEIEDVDGNRILIKYLDTINYQTGITEEYIKIYKITRYVGEKQLPHTYVYTELDFPRLSPDDKNSEYYRAVANHLLSIENIEHSNANGYIGELVDVSTAKNGLKVGEERFETESNDRFSSYTYQISPNEALYFDRIKKEAVKIYLEREKKREENDGR